MFDAQATRARSLLSALKRATPVERAGEFLIGNGAPSDSYFRVRLWFVRGLGLIYFFAAAIIFFQGRALWGIDGLLPILPYVGRAEDFFGSTSSAFWNLPSLFYFTAFTDLIPAMGMIGMALSVALILGYANFPILFLLWIGQMSFVNSGQLFYGYGWETQLLELTFLSFFLVPFLDPRLQRSHSPPPRIVIWAMRWMLFRLMLGAGLIKIRGDQCWRDLTCLIYHYETQPIPNPISYFYYQMPPAFHYGGVLFNHFAELIVPFGYFGPARVRRIAGLITVLFQCILISSGNLAWLNTLTLVMCIPCFDDEFLSWLTGWVPFRKSVPHSPPQWKRSWFQTLMLVAFTVTIGWLSIAPARNLIGPEQAMNTSYGPWHLVNSYGAFGSIGKERFDVIIEATDETEITAKTDWQPSEFKAAPGDVMRRPPFVVPYHYHLDWQIWFSGMRPVLQEEWLLRLAVRLLENDPEITALFERAPFGDKKPTYIKMDLYHYRFTDWKDWPQAWWTRTKVRQYMPPISLEHPGIQKYRKQEKPNE